MLFNILHLGSNKSIFDPTLNQLRSTFGSTLDCHPIQQFTLAPHNPILQSTLNPSLDCPCKSPLNTICTIVHLGQCYMYYSTIRTIVHLGQCYVYYSKLVDLHRYDTNYCAHCTRAGPLLNEVNGPAHHSLKIITVLFPT